MEKYIGVKIIHAEPATHGEYSKEKYGESTNSEFSIQNKDSEGYKVVYEDGYVSWSPKDVFEAAYRKTDGMTFGLAIEAMKKGFRVARSGWNGKGMWLVYVKPCKSFVIDESCNEKKYENLPWVGMKTADNKFVPWLASQTDILAEDWQIVE